MIAYGVIPARMAATRLPGKPLLDIGGKPMVQWVWERASCACKLEEVYIATPDAEIAAACEAFSAPVIRTRDDHPTGTDRMAEAAEKLDCDLLVNIQGDEPLIDPEGLDALVRAMSASDEDVRLGSMYFEINHDHDAEDPNLVKVVMDKDSHALYFSRCAIPYPRGNENPARFGHIGIYAWRTESLKQFARLPRSPLEIAESLEQLRALSQGWKVKMVRSEARPIGVDTPEDLERVRSILQA